MIDNSLILRGNLEIVNLIINYFLSEIIDPNAHEEIKKIALTGSQDPVNSTQIKSGYLSVYDFILYLGSSGKLKGKGIEPRLVELTTSAMVDRFLLAPSPSFLPNKSPRFKANRSIAMIAHELGLIHNLIFGFN